MKYFDYIEEKLQGFIRKYYSLKTWNRKYVRELSKYLIENVIPNKTDKNKFRKEFSIPKDAKLIGIVGRLVPIKNHQLFLEIAEMIIKECSDVYFAIIGDGELKHNIEEEILSRNLSDRVFITGFIKDGAGR